MRRLSDCGQILPGPKFLSMMRKWDLGSIKVSLEYTQVQIAGTEMCQWRNTGPVLAAKRRPMLLGQYQRLNRPNVVSVLAPYIGISNLPSFRQSWESVLLRQTMLEVEKPKFGPAVARYSAGHNLPVYWLWPPSVALRYIISVMAQYWHQVSATSLPILGQRWAVCDFALGILHF